MTMPGDTVHGADGAGDLSRHARLRDPGGLIEPEREQPRPIRVLVANLPDLVYQLIAGLIEQEPGMDVRGLPPDPTQSRLDRVKNLLLAVFAGTDVLILGAEQIAPLPPLCTHLLSAFPNLKIIALAENGEEAMMYWLGQREKRLDELSVSSLVQGIRQAHDTNPMD